MTESAPDLPAREAIFFGDRHRVGEPVGGPSHDLVGSHRGFFRHDRADGADDMVVQRAQFVDESHADAQGADFRDPLDDFRSEKNRVPQCRRSEYLVHDDDASRRRLAQRFVNSDQVVLQFAAKIADRLLSFEMRQDAIGEKEARAAARNETAEARQIMELPEHAGERGLAALIRTGDDKNAFRILEMEVVADDGRPFGREFMGQGQIEGVMNAKRLALVGNGRIARLSPARRKGSR